MISNIKEINKMREIFCYFRRNYAFDEVYIYAILYTVASQTINSYD